MSACLGWIRGGEICLISEMVCRGSWARMLKQVCLFTGVVHERAGVEGGTPRGADSIK